MSGNKFLTREILFCFSHYSITQHTDQQCGVGYMVTQMKHLIVLGCKVKQSSSLKFSLKFWIKLEDNRPNVAQQQMSDIQES